MYCLSHFTHTWVSIAKSLLNKIFFFVFYICSQTSLCRHILSTCPKDSDPTLFHTLLKTSVRKKVSSFFHGHGVCICMCVCMFRYVCEYMHACILVRQRTKADTQRLPQMFWFSLLNSKLNDTVNLHSPLAWGVPFLCLLKSQVGYHAQLTFMGVWHIGDAPTMYLSNPARLCYSTEFHMVFSIHVSCLVMRLQPQEYLKWRMK